MSRSQEQQQQVVVKDLVGKVAIVTGSSRGIGAEIALRLAEHGADIVINYFSSPKGADACAQRIRECGVKVITVQADVSKKSDIIKLFETAKKEFGKVHIVMSNSGIEHFGAVDEVTEEDIDRTFNVNVKAQYFVAQQAYKHLENDGRVILMSSISAHKGISKHAIYGASKAAIQGMVKCLAWDFGPRNITVNCIAPGGVKTDMYAEVAAKYIDGGENMSLEEIDNILGKWSPLNRPRYPADIAGIVALLASQESQWITGQIIQAGGGAQMS